MKETESRKETESKKEKHSWQESESEHTHTHMGIRSPHTQNKYLQLGSLMQWLTPS